MDDTAATTPKKNIIKKYAVYGVSVILIIGFSAATYFVQNRRIGSINNQLLSTQEQYQALEAENEDLSDRIDNLRSVNRVMQEQINASESDLVNQNNIANEPTSQEVALQPAGELRIIKYVQEPKINFAGPDDQYMPEGDVLAIYVEITNTSGSEQYYSVGDFKAITENGESVETTLYHPALTESWNNSNLIDGGTKEVALLYNNLDLKIVSLQWIAPGGSETITLPVPALQKL